MVFLCDNVLWNKYRGFKNVHWCLSDAPFQVQVPRTNILFSTSEQTTIINVTLQAEPSPQLYSWTFSRGDGNMEVMLAQHGTIMVTWFAKQNQYLNR